MTPKSNLSDQVSVYSVMYSMSKWLKFRARHKMTVLSFCVSDDGHHVCAKSSVHVSQSTLLVRLAILVMMVQVIIHSGCR